MIKSIRPALGALIASAMATSALLALSTSPAHAYSRHCSINGLLWPAFTTCTTEAVEANSSGHFLDVSVWPYSGCSAEYYIWDARNQAIIHRETTRGVSKRLYGVYSFYHLKMLSRGVRCGGDAVLDND